MSGQQIGYVRVSSEDQSVERQLNGLHLDRVFIDKVSGKDTNRPELKLLLSFAREGDTVVIHSMDRLARNLDNLRSLVKELTTKGVQVKFIKEGLTFSGDDSPIAQLLLSVMGAFAEFERSLIKERQREGIELAKKRGAYRGRKKSLDTQEIENIKRLVAEGKNKSHLAKQFGISRETLYRYIRGS
ncbi:DNA-invertase hin [Serratia marcescens]|mgnify:CR=1 FL=1|jgi:DNA invertase Pin-like site-specific DNA recombinase|uniref:recombinase family protein n=1 Tax=Enterobacterales TaxID=91347 RepID=UPI0007452F59|nr:MULTISPECIES: recombinase family protein [Yersiniaceae]CVB06013.1 DNA-invertase hin [Serratia marcescens]